MKRLVRFGWIMIMLAIGVVAYAAEDEPSAEIPPELGRWRSWVLHGHEEELCPTAYNDGTIVRCQWPSLLQMNITSDGGAFEQHWMMFADGWAALPGHLEMWPDGVVVDGLSEAVINRNNVPSVHLGPGQHQIKGRFYWSRIPEMIRVPPSVGLLSVTLEGRRIANPRIDAQGRLWIQEVESRTGEAERLTVQIFRLIDDNIPMRIVTLLRMDVSGQARELRLENVLPQNGIPMELVSALPARLGAGGHLLVQARPGRWEVRITVRMPEAVNKISAGSAPYGDEVWSFQPRHHLRMVEIEAVPQVEPGQTEMPEEWRGFSAYLIKSGKVMRFKEIRRGDPDPAPDRLTLFRQWWLDFDGGGFTMHDRVDGTLSRQWHLAMNAPTLLGRVSIDGRDQVITTRGDSKKAGVELRQGQLQLQSDARLIRNAGAMNAVGWDHDFQKFSGELYLPPGWRLLAAAGVDRAGDTWLQSWSLLDFFLVLIIALAVFKLRGWRWGVLALAAMALAYHEPGAPRLVWLHILAVLALLPLLPGGWFRRLVSLWGIGAVAVLLLITLPFAINQIRWGLYPQLAPHNDFRLVSPESGLKGRAAPMEQVMKAPASKPTAPKLPKSTEKALLEPESDIGAKTRTAGQAVWHQDPDALIPTGPGLPDWRWNAIGLSWNGPVAKDQTMHLFLLSPLSNLLLAVMRVVLLGLLIWGVVDWEPWWRRMKPFIKSGAALALAMLIFSSVRALPVLAGDNSFPPPELLNELQRRLMEPPDCLPYCADISRMEIAISGDNLQLIIKVHAADQSAVPLPVNRKSWTPDEILLDNAPIGGLSRDDAGGLWAVVPAGLHTIVLTGSVAQETMVQIPLPLKPHIATYVAVGWEIKGILPDGTVGSSLQATRIEAGRRGSGASRDRDAVPTFLQVRRVLQLGLTWLVVTTIERVTAVGAPVVASIPLLPGEAVTTAGLQVDQQQVLINMSADQRRTSYTSTLPISSQIQLKAPRAVPWTETWVLDASPIWHCDLEGIAAIHHQEGGRWQPQWQPWPGESVTIKISRPQAMKGQVMTLQEARLTLTPGRRFGQAGLALKINTSRGGQHTVELPPRSNLQSVLVNNKSLPVRQDGQWVTVPLQPGLQTVAIQWHQLAPFTAFFRTPAIKIGNEAVNAKVTIKMPRNRWILMAGGPRWGPAVLFWSYLAVIILAALGLGRLAITPLKTWQWILLGLGLTQVPAPMALIIVGWLLALGLREQRTMPDHWLGFNSLQAGLSFLTLAAMICLFLAVRAGLAGAPEMQIDGNGSTSWLLHWTQDRIGENLPRPWVFSLPVWSYRGLMLVWSLWLAYALLAWLKWGWRCFAKDGAWKKKPPKSAKTAAFERMQD